ncbi:hypothetical protein [Streptomyces sp. NPDC001450]
MLYPPTANLAVVRTLGDALAGTGKTLIGVRLTHTGDATRDAAIDANPSLRPRAIAASTEQGVRAMLVAIPPVTHSTRDRIGFIPRLIKIARNSGVSGYVDDGTNHWAAGHTLDVGRLYRLDLDKAPTGYQLYAAARTGTRGPGAGRGSPSSPQASRPTPPRPSSASPWPTAFSAARS